MVAREMSDRSRIHKKRHQSFLKLGEYIRQQHTKNVAPKSKVDWSLPLVCDTSGAGESSCRIERTHEILKTDERAVDRLFTSAIGKRAKPITPQFLNKDIKQVYTHRYQTLSSVHIAVAKEEILSLIAERVNLPSSVVLRVDRTNIIIAGQITEKWYQIECDTAIPLLSLFIQSIPPLKKLNNNHYISHSPSHLPLEDAAQTQKITFANGTVFARKVLRHTYTVGTGTLEPFWHYTLPQTDGTNLYYHLFPPVLMLNHHLSHKNFRLSVDMFIQLLVRRGGAVHCDIRRRNIAVIDHRLVLIDDHRQDGGEYLASNPYYYDCGDSEDLILPTTFYQDLLASFRVMASISGCVYPWSTDRSCDAVTLLFDKDMKLNGDKFHITLTYGDIYQISVLMRQHMRRLAKPSIDIESMILKHVSPPTASQLIAFRCHQEASGISEHVDG
ncbi:VP4 [Eriocheir sinensis reovirus]|uniref:VP4 n=1 Tax=Eriocheir sinensis reovirus TaxID=273810 RepID=A0A0E3X905_ESRV|nr:VP4 [Eriocheir sinensis reovirus]AKC01923.1 VP4 [Eriocheir sinensis reovirus]